MTRKRIIFIFIMFFITGCSAGSNFMCSEEATGSSTVEPEGSIVKVQVSSQSYSYVRPWHKEPTANREGLGVVVAKELVMVTAQLVQDATYIELQKNDGGPKSSARIREVDYKANIALLEPVDSSFLNDLNKITIGKNLAVNEDISVLFAKKGGKYERISGRVNDKEIGHYPFKSSLLLYLVKTDIPVLTDVSSLPIICDGILCGFGMGYDQKSEILTSVSLPVINHFMEDFADGQYDGFPFIGIDFSDLDDEQLRDYLKLKKDESGIYISRVRPGSPAAIAGILPGDVLLSVDGRDVDRFGKFEDEILESASISHYVSCAKFSGDEVSVVLFRDGKRQEKQLKLKAIIFGSSPVPSHLHGRSPNYLILGGLVLTELSLQYLEEWGPQWPIKAPERLVYYYFNQWDLLEPGQKVVLLSHVLPTRAMIGYDEFDNMIVNSVNGKKVNRLEDVAKALKAPLDRFHHLTFLENKKEIYLDRFTLEKENRFIQKRYGISRLQQLGTE